MCLSPTARELRDVLNETDIAELLNRALITHRDTAEWRFCDPVVATVENATFMNATLTGAL